MASIEERLQDASSRLIILAACGFARTVEHLLADGRSKRAIETAERFADGLATDDDALAAARAASPAAWASQAAEAAVWAARAAPAASLAYTARAAEAASRAIPAAAATIQLVLDCILSPRAYAVFPTHVSGLVSTIYDTRDWSLMPILADALEEMGLEVMAAHCRQPIHAKGCHVLDSILVR
jgi:hypothetical protein